MDQVGQKINIKKWKDYTGRRFPEKEGIAEIVSVNDEDSFEVRKDGVIYTVNTMDDWELVRGLEYLSVGDVILNGWEDDVKVLAVLAPGVYVISESDDMDHIDGTYTAKELKEDGFKVKPSESNASPREVTMAEVVAKFGENVVIRKDDE